MKPHNSVQEGRRRREEIRIRRSEDGDGGEIRVISKNPIQNRVQPDRKRNKSVGAQNPNYPPPINRTLPGENDAALIRDAARRGGVEGRGDAVHGEGAVEEHVGVRDRNVVDRDRARGGVLGGEGEPLVVGGEGFEAESGRFLEEGGHWEGGGDGVVAEEVAHRGWREGEVGEGGVLDGEEGGLRSGEEELRGDLEEGGGYVEAAAEAQGSGGVEGEGVEYWVSGGGVSGGGDGDACEAEGHGQVEGGVPPVGTGGTISCHCICTAII